MSFSAPADLRPHMPFAAKANRERYEDSGMIDGPRLKPASGGKAKSLVVFLHGYGADGNDLIDIGRHWAPMLPDTAFVSPHAPEPCGEAPVGRQWFPLSMRDPDELWQGVSRAAAPLNEFLDAELQRWSLTEDRMALVGFSQGTMMALHAGPRRLYPMAGIVGYSGLLAGPEHLEHDIEAAPPVLLVHGAEDPLIPAVALHHAASELGAASFDVEWHIRPGLQHGIDPEGLALGAAFLKRTLGA
jgi:phospholipase/carboxylesterase